MKISVLNKKYQALNKKYQALKKKRTELVASISSGKIDTKKGLKKLKNLDVKLYAFMNYLGEIHGKTD